MSLHIDRLDIRLQGDRGTAKRFAEALRGELARLEVPTGQVRLDRLELPPVAARPGESPAALARRTAAAIATAVRQQGRPR